MATKVVYQNSQGVDCVIVTNDDGSSWSGFKADYDLQIDQAPSNS